MVFESILSFAHAWICGEEEYRLLAAGVSEDGSSNKNAWRNATFSSLPHISECSQHVELSWLPQLFLLSVTLPILIHDLRKSQNLPATPASPVGLRIFGCIFLIVIHGVSLLHHITGDNPQSTTPYATGDLIQLIGSIVALLLTMASRNRGLGASGVMFCYWLLSVLCGFPEMRYACNQLWGTILMPSHFTVLIYIMHYVVTIGQLVLSCFADQPIKRDRTADECPELHSSFLSQLTFNWFTGMARLGNRKPLERDDLWDLNERDRSRLLVPQFNANFMPGVKAFLRKRANAAEQLKESDFPSVLIPIFKTHFFSLAASFFYKLIFDLLQFVAPALLKELISFIQDTTQPLYVGVGIALLMFFSAVLQSMLLHQYFHGMFRIGMNIRTALTSCVYRKALSLSVSAKRNRTTGEIVNLMSIDIQRFQDMASFVMLFWSAPLQVILSIFFLWRLLGWSVIAGIGILIALLPFNAFISTKMRNCQVEQMKHKDERLKLMSEILNGMKVLKLYAWEKSMQQQVLDIRQKEINVLKRMAFLSALTSLSWSCAPFLVAVLTFGVYVKMDPENNILTPQITFVALSLFNILRFPLAVFAMIFPQAIQCQVSNKRLKAFFGEEEMDSSAVDHKTDKDECINVSKANFAWDNSEVAMLQNINLTVKRGELVAVVGRVGSGKSSFLSALLGEMNKKNGRVSISGDIAYAPQQPWIQNLSLRDNILFNKPLDGDFYNEVLDACALRQDLASLPAEDLTEIGEKGINLSGGQKQRVSLARAVYSKNDVVLLDDVLSAVDSHVGKHIFEHVISSTTGILKDTTRILVTHGIHFLKHCDKVVVLKDGTISEIGTYRELMARRGPFSEFIEEFLVEEVAKRGRSVSFGEDEDEMVEILTDLERVDPAKRHRIESQMSQVIEEKEEESKISRQSSHRSKSPSTTPRREGSTTARSASQGQQQATTDTANHAPAKAQEKAPLLDGGDNSKKSNGKAPGAKTIEKEGMETGRVKWSVYILYMKAIGYAITLLFFSVYVFSSILGVWSNVWLANWSDDARKIQEAEGGASETNRRLLIYAALGVGQALTVCAASVIMALGMVRASRLLHESILTTTLHTPMSFLDVTPIGRIINRFGKDIETVDRKLPETFDELLYSVMEVAGTLYVILLTVPQSFPGLAAVAFLYIFCLDVDSVDSALPNTVRSLVATGVAAVATVFVIMFSTPQTIIGLILLFVIYFAVLELDVLDAKLPAAFMNFISNIVQGVFIMAAPVYVTPSLIFGMLPPLACYILLLDVDEADTGLPRATLQFLRTAVASVEILMVIVLAEPATLFAVLPLMAVYIVILRFYVSTSRQLKRLESTTRSPIYSHFQESIQGASSIRAYHVTDKFIDESSRRVDENLATYYPSLVANRWLAVRLELVGNLIVLFAALFAVLFREADSLSAGLVGLSVSYALNITQTLNWAVRMTSELETSIVAVERIDEYAQQTTEGRADERAPRDKDWPTKGTIDFKDYKMRYRPGLDLVLKGVTAHVDSGQKVGIVGRTGAGKSSLTLALFRIVEADGGIIEIDGERIDQLKLETLRSRLTIVPQEPVLFSGTLRLNLDPFSAYNDEEVWKAIREAHLDTFVKSLADGINHTISEGGENLSVGQRQLLCLARALLRKTKVLVLDEAAAAVDIETDALIQKAIREQFKECTVLTIAHRLNTILDYDILFVMDDGRIAECDTPSALLARPDSLFRSMAEDAGIAVAH